MRFILPDPDKASDPVRRSKHYRLSLYLITLAGIIFRSELAVLLFTITSYLYLTGQITLRREILPAGLSATLIALALTIPIDSFFWQRFPLWPELSALTYNVFSGNASNWGTSPPYYYFYSSLPRLLLNPLTYLLCIPLALYNRPTQWHATSLLLPSLNFLVLYSFLPHKEWRFIIYVIPPITAAASLGAAHIWLRRSKTLLYRLASILLILSVASSFFISNFVLLPISAINYPGASALNKLHFLADGSKKIIAVHMDNLSCQTGVTRFLERPPPQSLLFAPEGATDQTLWVYDKTEDETQLLTPAFWDRFDYVLAERPEKVIGKWEVLDTVHAFTGVELLEPGKAGWLERMGVECADDSECAERGKSERKRGRELVELYVWVEELARRYVTGGWWVGVMVEPRIRILKKVVGSGSGG